MGSMLFLASWAALMGPRVYLQHLLSGPRLPFTAAYFGSIGLTLYFAIGVRDPLPFPASLFLSPSQTRPVVLSASLVPRGLLSPILIAGPRHNMSTLPG